jgi:fatty-acyl-CoA synthase
MQPITSQRTNHGKLTMVASGIEPLPYRANIRLTNDQTEYIINNSEDKVIFIDATLVHY